YNITIAARTILPQSGISFSQERLLKLVVEIENPLYFEETKEEEKVISNLNQNSYEKQESINNFNFYPLIILIIILISIIIYKYS
ncbi:MAG: hypothetical protein QXZ20_04175, partial [Candidatus Aenigmatarchaeota archaeon]